MRRNKVLSQDYKVTNVLQTINEKYKNKSRNEHRVLNSIDFNSEKLPAFNARIRNILDDKNEHKVSKKSKSLLI